MAFWTQATTEPKRNYKFRVTLTGVSTGQQDAGASNILWWAKSVTTPSFDVSNVEHHHFDNRYYYPGRVTWNPISLVLVDPITIDAADITVRMLANQGYQPGVSTEANKTKTINKSDATGTSSLGTVTIEVFDSNNNVVETWTLNNPFIESAKFGDLDYSNDDLKTIEMGIRYDWASFQGAGDGADERFVLSADNSTED